MHIAGGAVVGATVVAAAHAHDEQPHLHPQPQQPHADDEVSNEDTMNNVINNAAAMPFEFILFS